jgi:heme-degrading monooxygenase HmoA
MPTTVLLRTPGTPDLYDRVNEEMGVENNLPDGLIHHYAAAAGDEMIIFDVWQSREHFERFQQERLMPAVMKVMGDQMPPGEQPEPILAELHNEFPK